MRGVSRSLLSKFSPIRRTFSQPIILLATAAGAGFEHGNRADIAPIVDLQLLIFLDLIDAQDLQAGGVDIAADQQFDLHLT